MRDVGKRPFLTHLFCGLRTRSVLTLDLQMRGERAAAAGPHMALPARAPLGSANTLLEPLWRTNVGSSRIDGLDWTQPDIPGATAENTQAPGGDLGRPGLQILRLLVARVARPSLKRCDRDRFQCLLLSVQTLIGRR